MNYGASIERSANEKIKLLVPVPELIYDQSGRSRILSPNQLQPGSSQGGANNVLSLATVPIRQGEAVEYNLQGNHQFTQGPYIQSAQQS